MFNCLDLMENESFISKLKFGIGDGSLQVRALARTPVCTAVSTPAHHDYA